MILFLKLFFVLAAAHFLFDFPLQGQYLADGKNRFKPIPGTPWYWCMGGHCMLHAAAVYLITGSIILGFAELLAHLWLDDAKCAGDSTFDRDKICHLTFKLIWACCAMSWDYHSPLLKGLIQ
jgi:hypothetical protein